jgi:hypothetical protein
MRYYWNPVLHPSADDVKVCPNFVLVTVYEWNVTTVAQPKATGHLFHLKINPEYNSICKIWWHEYDKTNKSFSVYIC